jgi:hypothetical protein
MGTNHQLYMYLCPVDIVHIAWLPCPKFSQIVQNCAVFPFTLSEYC